MEARCPRPSLVQGTDQEGQGCLWHPGRVNVRAEKGMSQGRFWVTCIRTQCVLTSTLRSATETWCFQVKGPGNQEMHRVSFSREAMLLPVEKWSPTGKPVLRPELVLGTRRTNHIPSILPGGCSPPRPFAFKTKISWLGLVSPWSARRAEPTWPGPCAPCPIFLKSSLHLLKEDLLAQPHYPSANLILSCLGECRVHIWIVAMGSSTGRCGEQLHFVVRRVP